MLNRKKDTKNVLPAESIDVFYCHKHIIQQIVRTDTVSGVGARLIRLESPTELIGKGLQISRLAWNKIQSYRKKAMLFWRNSPGKSDRWVAGYQEGGSCFHFLAHQPRTSLRRFFRKRIEKQCHVVKANTNRWQSATIACVFVFRMKVW